MGMNTEYGRVPQGSYPAADKLNLTYNKESHLLVLNQNGIETKFRVKVMKEGHEDLSLTPQQKDVLGQTIAALLSARVDKDRAEIFDTLCITKEGVISSIEENPIVPFSKADALIISNLFSGKISPLVGAKSPPIDPSRVSTEPRESQTWSIASFFKGALAMISNAFANLVGFFQKHDEMEIDFEAVNPEVNEAVPDILEEEFQLEREQRAAEINAITDEDLEGAFLTEEQKTELKNRKTKFDAEKALDELIDKNE